MTNRTDFVNKIIARMMLMCGLWLAVALVIKRFNPTLFETEVKYDRLIAVCDFIDNIFWKHVVNGVLFIAISNVLYYAMIPNYRKKAVQLSIIAATAFAIKTAVEIMASGSAIVVFPLLSIIGMIIVPLIYGSCVELVIIVMVYDVLAQLVSLVTRGVPIMQ